ncbi:MAG TPA: M14 family metallopeptidase [Acidimicrobiia bacterium]|nr:M14 family metallopeptidase [Acidimicrobiia bacterium]
MSVRRVDVGPAGGFDHHRFEAGTPGPRMVVLGGVHGDETEGAAAALRLAHEPPVLSRGVLDIVPVCHEAAFDADSRTSPVDGLNLARVFPGDPNGTATSRLAHHLNIEVLQGADFLIDLHTSGTHYDMPSLAGYGGQRSGTGSVTERAAIAFGAQFVWRHPGRSQGRTVSMVEHGMYVESPGFGPTNLEGIAAYVDGVLRILESLSMLAGPAPSRSGDAIRVTGGGDLDRDMLQVVHRGLFVPTVASGDRVAAGRPLGAVQAFTGATLEKLVAPSDGYVMALKRRSPVHPGDLVVNLAQPD